MNVAAAFYVLTEDMCDVRGEIRGCDGGGGRGVDGFGAQITPRTSLNAGAPVSLDDVAMRGAAGAAHAERHARSAV